ncbi:MAG: HPr family phosphocarrier protein [Oceanospirillaceae bacterium]|jgi:phosphocarrier protein|uniref:HPr family phosphocarrier protein n=1 Tax=Marinobacterium litorale TaxID=404770 RepID=UPI0003FC1096|nr:HPr family phosphocarrier protein [Marinobacterium litorale]MBS99610.1 HPr family phosphocarrier protein [Oceanospirillaceae bacterium]
MIEKQLTIINKLGLHARAAAKLINTTGHFSSQIKIDKQGREVDGKSIMAVMMLAASQGTELTFRISGDDEQDAMTAIETLINNRFDEPE